MFHEVRVTSILGIAAHNTRGNNNARHALDASHISSCAPLSQDAARPQTAVFNEGPAGPAETVSIADWVWLPRPSMPRSCIVFSCPCRSPNCPPVCSCWPRLAAGRWAADACQSPNHADSSLCAIMVPFYVAPGLGFRVIVGEKGGVWAVSDMGIKPKP